MRILVCPLDWGLGHAARCVPVIQYLLEKKIEVVIGAEGIHLIFFKEHFPALEYVDFPGYRISYSNLFSAGIKVFFQIPKIAAAIKKEHKLLKAIIREKKIDAVISDNRYGLWSKEIPCVIITHQLHIQAPVGNSFLSKTLHKHIQHFDACWIPDYEGKENLSGGLSHPIPKGINGKYIGPLSRFESHPDYSTINKKYDLLAILSGPEPQRSRLEEIILKQLKNSPTVKALIIQGLPGNTIKESGLHNVELVPHLSDTELQEKINSSDVILSRPGYSTLMDLQAIGWKKSIFIPTPGQTEQEYLGKLMQEKALGISYRQNDFLLKGALERVTSLSLGALNYSKENFKGTLDSWIEKITQQ